MDPRITVAARLQQQKNYPAAEQIYRQILRNQPGNPDALLLLGLLLHETGRNELAVEPLRRSIAIQPNRPEARQTLVTVLQAIGKIPEAVAEALQVVRLKPQDAEAQYAVAQLMLQARDPAGALPYIRRATELQPKSPAVFVTLSRVYLALEQHPWRHDSPRSRSFGRSETCRCAHRQGQSAAASKAGWTRRLPRSKPGCE